MKIALIQDEIYLPSYGGGTKANRCLLEGLARQGHSCYALTRALTRSSDGPNDPAMFQSEMHARGIEVTRPQSDLFRYEHRGVRVDALDMQDDAGRQAYIANRLKELDADWVLVTDDKRRFMLEGALHGRPDRVILLLQTIVQLPFGPLSVSPDESYAAQMSKARDIVVISKFAQDYIHEHSALRASLIPLPVYGDGPFPDFGKPDRGYVTMINPCSLKGISIFLEIARLLPEVAFAAVPTWGASSDDLQALNAQANVTILPATDQIDEILAQTKILLVPSLWPETFGYVVPEAMLRGIPVLASRIGGLPEAKLGVEYLIDVEPGTWHQGKFVAPKQDAMPWVTALRCLLEDPGAYADCSARSREAATAFVREVSVEPFESLMNRLGEGAPEIHPEFQKYIDRQPYTLDFDGFQLTVEHDVFPPDMGRCATNMARLLRSYHAKRALDMGCGSGYLAMAMKRAGIEEVWAADVHEPAVICARRNVAQNFDSTAIHVLQSDLFKSISPEITFDLIVFNQPFGPGNGTTVCGCGADGGYQITRRFLLEVPRFLSERGVVMMAFSDREAMEHSPERVAKELGYPVKIILHAFYGGANNYIYEMHPPQRLR
jgi:glycosyltransferase involved in cell wall biosynthesis/SAM-dependent methyltransferase